MKLTDMCQMSTSATCQNQKCRRRHLPKLFHANPLFHEISKSHIEMSSGSTMIGWRDVAKQQKYTIGAGRGGWVPVLAGDQVEVINVSGTQVVDFWCFPKSSPQQYLSLEHCREVLGKIYFFFSRRCPGLQHLRPCF